MLDAFTRFAHRLADAAGDAIRPYFGAHGTVDTKGDQSPVTQADRAAEAAMRALIEAEYPDHGIFGEEHGQTGLDNKYIWVLDPIDGTRAFIAGKQEWGTLIALCDDGIPILGILNQPITGERWLGVKGQPTLFFSSWRAERGNNCTEIQTRRCPTLAQAVISTTYCAPPDDRRFAALAAQCAQTIEGGDCYAYGMLARGARDIVCDTALKPWDILALVPIVEGAGGTVRAWDGAAITLTHADTALAHAPGLSVPI